MQSQIERSAAQAGKNTLKDVWTARWSVSTGGWVRERRASPAQREGLRVGQDTGRSPESQGSSGGAVQLQSYPHERSP